MNGTPLPNPQECTRAINAFNEKGALTKMSSQGEKTSLVSREHKERQTGLSFVDFSFVASSPLVAVG